MLLLVALTLMICATRAADAPGAVPRLDHADFVASDAIEPLPDSAAWRPLLRAQERIDPRGPGAATAFHRGLKSWHERRCSQLAGQHHQYPPRQRRNLDVLCGPTAVRRMGAGAAEHRGNAPAVCDCG